MRALSFLLTLFLISFALALHAQTGAGYFNPSPVVAPNLFTPEAAALGKYGTYNINHSTGTPHINIPLYELKSAGVTVPIILNYDATGLMPNKSEGMVGLNWTVMTGGAITRKVNGVPDDKFNPNPSASEQLDKIDKGFIYGHWNPATQQYENNSGTTDEYIRTIQWLDDPADWYQTPSTNPAWELPYEFVPDVFSFNFLGHQGKFMMSRTGEIVVQSDRRYTVDLTLLKPQHEFGFTIANITTDLNTLNSAIYSPEGVS